MQYTTEEYREEMHLPFRGKSSVYIYIGLINNDAQRSAHITSTFSGNEEGLYINSSESYAGVASTENDGHITFAFDGTENNIAGLTITFTEQPTSITVTNGSKTSIYGVDSLEFTVDDGFENCSYLTITPDSGKLKMKSIIFGIGLQFTGKQIINTNRSNVVNHISNELPRKTFTFTIDNRLHLFNKDNPHGYNAFLQEKQEVSYNYTREMSGGDTFTIKGGVVLLQSWSSDDYTAKFSCVGRLDYMDADYYRGQCSKEGIPADEVVEDIFNVAGVTEYKIDPALKACKLYNPIPVVSCREALQMIVNACRCVLYEDRDGNVCLMNANRPSFVGDVTFTGATSYSIESTIFDDNSALNYATSERDYALADGGLIFVSENGGYVSTGFVSSELASTNGTFSANPQIDVSLASEYHMRKMILNFANVIPSSITIQLYLSGSLVTSETITSVTEATAYEYDGTIDGIKITFNGAGANQRIHLNNIVLDGNIEYELTYRELKGTPIATSLDKVKKIDVHQYNYYKQGEEPADVEKAWVDIDEEENDAGGLTTDISTSDIYDNPVATVQATIGDNLVILNDPTYDYEVSAGTIKESGAYYIIVTSDKEQEISIKGKYYTVTDNVYSIDIHEKGVEKKSTNPLIGSKTMAMQQAEWLKDYYDDDLEYTLTYRGDPILDADDLIYLENRFVANNQVRIEEESISTSMGIDFSCILRARRNSFQVDSTTETAIVGRVKVGEVL